MVYITMLVVHIAFECAPIYKTGGLADVIGSLPIALQKLGVESAVLMPGFGWIKKPSHLPQSRVPVWYIDSPYFKNPDKSNDHALQARRYAHFALQTLILLKKNKIAPDILHCHDWHTALIPYLLYTNPDPFFSKTRTLLTIHNIAFQGEFPAKFLDTTKTWQLFESIDKSRRTISYLRLGISSADYISTVSENHVQEIKSGIADFGLKELINLKSDRFSGILNGIDYSVWNPQKDVHIPCRYSRSDVNEMKVKNKLALQKKLGLDCDLKLPLFGFIARLSKQKGVDLIVPLFKKIREKKMQVVILGKGDKKIETALQRYAAPEYQTSICIRLSFDEVLAHQIYAGSDFFLIPSHYEPCGLTQMIAMRYGSIPIASSVGGLKDSITDGENGLLFDSVDETGFMAQIDRSLKLWQNRELVGTMIQKAMKTNFSWTRSALKYHDLYKKILS